MADVLRPLLRSLLVGFVRRTWLVAVATIAVCSVITARTVEALSVDEPVRADGVPLTSPARTAPPPRVAPDGAQLVARNMFCSTCGGIVAGPAAAGAALSAILISTTVAPDPIATVRVPETEVQGSWALGERIPGVGTIARIGGASIDVVDDAGTHTTLSLLSAVAGRGEDGAATPTSPPAAGAFSARVSKRADGSYEVDRSLVRELATGATKAGKLRALPIVEGGEVKGVKLLGVKPGSAPAAIGLRSADVLDSIDGQPIKTAQQMLELYARLDQLSTVTLQGTRAGKPLAVTLHLR